ncbi:hypothetical protein CHARACLAT_019691 [Characodon lateralis]|uniref:Uncharacterized protein n=1 Tax=Characodon lateralis TaxID=208331 RepID=A0ABU7DAB2_9TELE|nr:hypothetical protein [Characodon lateralis]
MQYILSYRSRFCPLSSLCSISSVGKERKRFQREKTVCWMDSIPKTDNSESLPPPPSLPFPSICSLSETSGGCGISCLVAFAKKKKNGSVHHLIFAASFLSL